MNTELICVGTELMTGKLNTNCSYIGERMSALGLDLTWVTSVPDRLEVMEDAVRRAVERSRIVLITGGLGPTFDDITREAVAAALKRTMTLDTRVLAVIAERFCRRNLTMPKMNERQAEVIAGATVLANPNGTAPGQKLDLNEPGKGRTLLFILPGPPREMQAMFEHDVFPFLKTFEQRIKKSFVLHVFGLGESIVDERIRPVVEAEHKLESGLVDFTILAHQSMVVDVKASVSGKDEMLVDETLNALRHQLSEILGDNMYGEDRATLEGVVGELLGKHRKTLATAESCTGGLIAEKITNVSGSSMYFKEGVVCYANESKTALLGVPEKTLSDHGAVSEQTARAMAEGIRRIAGTDYGISVTGIAGPGGATASKPVGLVYIGIAGPAGTAVQQYRFPGSRHDVRERAANQALDVVRRALMAETPPSAQKKARRK